MFATSLLECAPNLQNRRRWTLLLSVTFQAAAVSLALTYPLFHLERLPLISTVPKIAFSAPTIVRVVPVENDFARSASTSELQWPQQITVRHTGASVSHTDSTERQPDGTFMALGPAGPQGALRSLFASTGVTVLRPVPINTKPLRLSHPEESRLVQKIQPIYPPIARQLHIQGDVQLTALIAKDGSIEGLRILSGHPLLIRAALDAVSQWRYKPYVLNGSAVEVETTIKVTFRLEQ